MSRRSHDDEIVHFDEKMEAACGEIERLFRWNKGDGKRETYQPPTEQTAG